MPLYCFVVNASKTFTGQSFSNKFRLMRTKNFIISCLFALTGGLASWTTAQAVETPKAEDSTQSPSLLERYTNAAQDVILKGFELVGVNYRFGGNDAASGLDCSGFVRLVFKETVGLLLPRTAREMSEVGRNVDSNNELKAGDLVFFNTMHRAFSHVGIYLGDNYFLHAPRTGAQVRIESMQNSYWSQRYNGARRVIGGGN